MTDKKLTTGTPEEGELEELASAESAPVADEEADAQGTADEEALAAEMALAADGEVDEEEDGMLELHSEDGRRLDLNDGDVVFEGLDDDVTEPDELDEEPALGSVFGDGFEDVEPFEASVLEEQASEAADAAQRSLEDHELGAPIAEEEVDVAIGAAVTSNDPEEEEYEDDYFDEDDTHPGSSGPPSSEELEALRDEIEESEPSSWEDSDPNPEERVPDGAFPDADPDVEGDFATLGDAPEAAAAADDDSAKEKLGEDTRRRLLYGKRYKKPFPWRTLIISACVLLSVAMAAEIIISDRFSPVSDEVAIAEQKRKDGTAAHERALELADVEEAAATRRAAEQSQREIEQARQQMWASYHEGQEEGLDEEGEQRGQLLQEIADARALSYSRPAPVAPFGSPWTLHAELPAAGSIHHKMGMDEPVPEGGLWVLRVYTVNKGASPYDYVCHEWVSEYKSLIEEIVTIVNGVEKSVWTEEDYEDWHVVSGGLKPFEGVMYRRVRSKPLTK